MRIAPRDACTSHPSRPRQSLTVFSRPLIIDGEGGPRDFPGPPRIHPGGRRPTAARGGGIGCFLGGSPTVTIRRLPAPLAFLIFWIGIVPALLEAMSSRVVRAQGQGAPSPPASVPG